MERTAGPAVCTLGLQRHSAVHNLIDIRPFQKLSDEGLRYQFKLLFLPSTVPATYRFDKTKSPVGVKTFEALIYEIGLTESALL